MRPRGIAQTPRRSGRLAPALAAALLLPAAALAAGEGAGEGAAHGGGWWQFGASVVNFAILAGVLYYFFRRPIAEFFRRTAHREKESLDDARAEAEDTERRLNDQKKNLESLQAELDSLRAEARAEMDAEKARQTDEAEALARRIREQVSHQVEQARHQTMADLRGEMAFEAVRIAERLVRERLDEERQRRLVREHMEQLEKGS